MKNQTQISSFLPILLSAISLGTFLNVGKAQAQLIPDNTLGSESSIVVPQDALNDVIEGGAQRGSNLFQSFSEFNVGEGRGVTFANPPGVENILNRVTGGNPSNIFGRLGVAGNANLFLINPAGIIFGPNAILDVSGSFTATTADGFQLGEGGFFSATNIAGSSLLSVSPSALFFNQVAAQQTGNITVNSSFNNLSADSNLSLLSTNNIFIENPLNLQAGTGNIDLKADVDGDLTGDFIVTNTANTIATNGRDITITGANIITGDIDGASDTDAGNITIEASGNISTGNLSSDIFIVPSTGDGGAITLEADGDITTGDISSYTYSYDLNSGDGGAITLNADGDINTGNLDSRSFAGNNTGNGGAISLEANGDINTGNIDSLTFSYFGGSVAGNGGSINLTAEGNINTGGFNSQSTSTSGIATDGGTITLEAEGDINPGNIDSSSVSGISNENTGNAGSISISSGNNINLTNGNVLASGQTAGSITIESAENISVQGILIQNINSGTGNGGNIEITTNSLSVTNNAEISTVTLGEGTTGNVIINATDFITIDESTIATSSGTPTVDNQIGIQAPGNAGNITIITPQLSLLNGGQITANTFGTGNAGNINITATESILLDGFGFGVNDTLQVTALFSATINDGTGDGGNIVINTDSIIVSNQAQINTNTEVTGNAGNITINVTESISLDTGNINSAVVDGTGSAGDINLNVSEGNLSLTNGGQIVVTTQGDGDAGNANIIAESILLDGSGTISNFNDETGIVEEEVVNSGISSESLGENSLGNGGTINIDTDSLTINDGGFITVQGEGLGDGGDIDINASENIEITGGFINSDSTGIGTAGNINITTTGNIIGNDATISATSLQTGGGDININANEILVENSSLISTSVFNGDGGGGNITIITEQFTALEDSDILANAIEGAGGNILIDADALVADVFANGGPDNSIDITDFDSFQGNGTVDISASSESGVDGTVDIPDITFLENSLIGLDGGLVNAEQVVAGSCIARKTAQRGTFAVTGTDSLPNNPFQRLIGEYELTGVNNIGGGVNNDSVEASIPDNSSWKMGDSVVEAGGIIVTDSGKVMLGSMSQVTEIAKADDLVCN